MRVTALPEGMDYPDTGCHVSPSCLACPLARCIYDVPKRLGTVQRLEARDQDVRRLRDAGLTVGAIIKETGLGRRTVYRSLRVSR